MDLKKALISGIIVYALIFLFVSALMFVPGMYDQTTKLWVEWSHYIVLIFGFVMAYLVGRYYYFKQKPKEFVKEGFLLGIVMMVISILIEIPVMVYGFAAQMGWAWFAQWNLWAGYIAGIIATILAAYTKK